MLVQALVFVIVSMGLQQSMSAPYLDRLNINVQEHGHLFEGEHTGVTQAIISVLQTIVTTQASYHLSVERLTPSGYSTLFVEEARNLDFGVVIQQGIDFGHNPCRGLTQLPPGFLEL